jgi:Uma2 family endonuclease
VNGLQAISKVLKMEEARKLEGYSYEDYLEIDRSTPEHERYELIDGVIYMMAGASAAHQDVVLNIAVALRETAQNGCKARVAPFDLKLECGGGIHVVQPDVMLFCGDSELPCLLWEVLSPSTAAKDKGPKKDLYERCGIREYCIVDLHERIVDLYRLTGTDDGKEWYRYVRGYGEEDRLYLECLGAEIEVEALFEGIETK